MAYARKVVIPADAEMTDVTPVKDSIKEKIYGKTHKIIELIYQLALIKGFDNQGRIIDKNGNVISNTSLTNLITHAMSAGKVLHGENDFIDLLKRANVNPDLILNENVKSKLHNLYSRTTQVELQPKTTVYETRAIPAAVAKPVKRRHEEVETEEEGYKGDDDDDDQDGGAETVPPVKRMRPIATVKPRNIPPSTCHRHQLSL